MSPPKPEPASWLSAPRRSRSPLAGPKAPVETPIAEEFPIAFAEQELAIHYLPIFDLKQRQMVALEPQPYWTREPYTDTPPHAILKAARQHEKLAELEDWWLPQVMVDIQHLETRRNFPRVMVRLLNIVNPQRLYQRIQDCRELHLIEKPILLIDESDLHHGGRELLEMLCQLGDKGYRIAVDRFGRGHTSYSHLLRLPLSYVKLDPTLVEGAIANERDGTLIYDIVRLAGALDVQVIAGGIRDEARFWLMCNAGCELGEGELFLGPQMIDSFLDTLAPRASHRVRRRRILR